MSIQALAIRVNCNKNSQLTRPFIPVVYSSPSDDIIVWRVYLLRLASTRTHQPSRYARSIRAERTLMCCGTQHPTMGSQNALADRTASRPYAIISRSTRMLWSLSHDVLVDSWTLGSCRCAFLILLANYA